MIKVKEERIRKIFHKCYNSDTDWSLAADRFISWCINRNFETESFHEFVNWIDDDELNRTWHFFFGYGDDFEKFAEDWIEEEEQEDYLRFCLDQQ